MDDNIILGLDLGDRHIGVAIGNLITKTATPLQDIDNNRDFIDSLHTLRRDYRFSKIVIGLPVTATGQYGEQARKAMDLVTQIKAEFDLDVALEDERFTTQAASKFLAANPSVKASIDGASAKLILESWLVRQP